MFGTFSQLFSGLVNKTTSPIAQTSNIDNNNTTISIQKSSVSSSGSRRTYENNERENELIYQSLKSHYNFLITKYDSNLIEHVNLLKSIFKIIFGTNLQQEEICNCQKWTVLGFQNKDPSTDLRSLGILGLCTMEYLCKYHTSSVKNEYMNREYPFACCVFSIVNFMVSEMNMRQILTSNYCDNSQLILLMKKELYFNGDNLKQLDLFERLFCILFEYFDYLWTKKHQASYMDFPIVYDIFTKNVNNVLKKEPGTFG